MIPPDDFTEYHAELLDSTYDCVDRIVLKAYCPLLHSPGGFRTWWRQLSGSDEDLNDNHLMRLAGRFSRRVHAWAKRRRIRVVHCRPGERKHELAEAHLPSDPDFRGVFLVLVSKMRAPVWHVQRHAGGGLHLEKKLAYVNHYAFHIVDREWGHVTILLSGHAPFGGMVILNGHEWVERRAKKQGIPLRKESNAFVEVFDGAALAKVAEALSADERTVGRLAKVCDRWIYSAALCFALGSEEQARSGFRFAYSVFQLEYSRNLLYRRGRDLEEVHQGLVDRARRPLDVRTLTTIFGRKQRPQVRKGDRRMHRPRFEKTVETLSYDLTVFKVHFGCLTLKIYDKGERLQRIEAIAHHVDGLRCGRRLGGFPGMVSALREMLVRFLNVVRCADVAFLDQGTLDDLPLPTQRGKRRLAGVDLNKPRMRAVVEALIALAPNPRGFSVPQLAAQVRRRTGWSEAQYGARQAGYDLGKIRGKGFVERADSSRCYRPIASRFGGLCALSILREKVLKPLLAGVGNPRRGRPPKNIAPIDAHYEALCQELRRALGTLGIAA